MYVYTHTHTRLRNGRSGGRNPEGTRNFLVLQTVQTGFGAHPAACSMGTGYFAGIRRPGREFRHSPSSSGRVRNEWSYNSTQENLYLCIHISVLVPGDPGRLGTLIYVVTMETLRPVGARHSSCS
jgi:hypothetical protein